MYIQNNTSLHGDGAVKYKGGSNAPNVRFHVSLYIIFNWLNMLLFTFCFQYAFQIVMAHDNLSWVQNNVLLMSLRTLSEINDCFEIERFLLIKMYIYIYIFYKRHKTMSFFVTAT